MEKETKQKLEIISNFSNRSEKTSWNRKLDNMIKLMSKLAPIEDEILEIIKIKKQPILDEINKLRQTMVNMCIHPIEQLIEHEDHVSCKFCNRKFNINETK